jgi:hypothetical protein
MASVEEWAGLVATLEADLEGSTPARRHELVERLRGAREGWGRALARVAPDVELVPAVRSAVEAGLSPAEARAAAAQLAEAERLQWSLGTLATGAGEGLASMAEVRALQLARAWLLSVDGAAEDARALALEVRDDPNRLGARLRPHIDALLDRLG